MADRGSSAAHTRLIQQIRKALGREKWLVIWQLKQGHGSDERGHHFPLGLVPGASDLLGILSGGRWFALEVKTGKSKPTKSQSQFIALVNRMGGYAVVVHSVGEAREAAFSAQYGHLTQAGEP